jgi:hypothetical protein
MYIAHYLDYWVLACHSEGQFVLVCITHTYLKQMKHKN